MINGTKEKHDIYIKTMLTNVANDEKCYIIEKRSAFVDNIHACGTAYEEFQNCKEALNAVEDTLKTVWEYNRRKIPQSEILKQYRMLSTRAYLLMLEAMHINAVALKAEEQLMNYEEVIGDE